MSVPTRLREELIEKTFAELRRRATAGELPGSTGPLPMRSMAIVAVDSLIAVGAVAEPTP